MYASRVDDQSLTFFVSGKLWGGSLVMQDKETGSEWSHILGQSMAGKLAGRKLTIIPSSMTNWEAWRSKHPKTTATVIEPTAGDFTSEMLANSERFGIGLVDKGKARFWRFDQLLMNPVVNDQLGDLKMVVHLDACSRTPHAWNRRIGEGKLGQVLEFSASEQGVRDAETDTKWDLQRGIATEGELSGTKLVALPAIVSFTYSWQRFHPETSVWQQNTQPKR